MHKTKNLGGNFTRFSNRYRYCRKSMHPGRSMAEIGVLNESVERRRTVEPGLRESMSSYPGTLESVRRVVRGDERDGDGDGEGPSDRGRRRQISGRCTVAGSGVVARVGRNGVGEDAATTSST
jgi:hypothetical protein